MCDLLAARMQRGHTLIDQLQSLQRERANAVQGWRVGGNGAVVGGGSNGRVRVPSAAGTSAAGDVAGLIASAARPRDVVAAVLDAVASRAGEAEAVSGLTEWLEKTASASAEDSVRACLDRPRAQPTLVHRNPYAGLPMSHAMPTCEPTMVVRLPAHYVTPLLPAQTALSSSSSSSSSVAAAAAAAADTTPPPSLPPSSSAGEQQQLQPPQAASLQQRRPTTPQVIKISSSTYPSAPPNTAPPPPPPAAATPTTAAAAAPAAPTATATAPSLPSQQQKPPAAAAAAAASAAEASASTTAAPPQSPPPPPPATAGETAAGASGGTGSGAAAATTTPPAVTTTTGTGGMRGGLLQSLVKTRTVMRRQATSAKRRLQEKAEVVSRFYERMEAEGKGAPHDEVERLGLLGKGSYGTVERVRYAKTGHEVARKIVLLSSETCSCVGEAVYKTEQIAREVQMSLWGCEHMLRSTRVCASRELGEVYIESELMDLDLEKLLTRLGAKVRMPEAFVAYITFAIASAVHFLHTKDAPVAAAVEGVAEGGDASVSAQRIIHRDLKPNNVLLHRDGRVLMTDFGVAKAVKSLSEQPALQTECGNYAYMSPETMNQQGGSYSLPADLWSVGMVAAHLLCGVHPIQAHGYELCKIIMSFDWEKPVGWVKPVAGPEALGMRVCAKGGSTENREWRKKK